MDINDLFDLKNEKYQLRLFQNTRRREFFRASGVFFDAAAPKI